jgi:hypothetical protein
MSLKFEPEPLLDFMLGPPPIDGLRIVDLSPNACRWPRGDPKNLHEFRYCGASASRSVYCERHEKLSKTPKALEERKNPHVFAHAQRPRSQGDCRSRLGGDRRAARS